MVSLFTQGQPNPKVEEEKRNEEIVERYGLGDYEEPLQPNIQKSELEILDPLEEMRRMTEKSTPPAKPQRNEVERINVELEGEDSLKEAFEHIAELKTLLEADGWSGQIQFDLNENVVKTGKTRAQKEIGKIKQTTFTLKIGSSEKDGSKKTKKEKDVPEEMRILTDEH